MARVLASASRLQKVVPDAVLVGRAAAAYDAEHRQSFDHDHVMADLEERYAEIVESVEATDGWVTSVRASSPPLTLLGSLDGVEAGLRQLRRVRPLEVEEVTVDGHRLRVPTLPECLRVKAFLMVQRNQVRDYLDVVALADRLGGDLAVTTLDHIDDYSRDRSEGDDGVLTAVVQRLSQPAPRDVRVTGQLRSYKGLVERWHEWSAVVADCRSLADAIVEEREETR